MEMGGLPGSHAGTRPRHRDSRVVSFRAYELHTAMVVPRRLLANHGNLSSRLPAARTRLRTTHIVDRSLDLWPGQAIMVVIMTKIWARCETHA